MILDIDYAVFHLIWLGNRFLNTWLSRLSFKFRTLFFLGSNFLFVFNNHDATSLLFLLRMPSKITLVYIYKNHMMRNRLLIMLSIFSVKFFCQLKKMNWNKPLYIKLDWNQPETQFLGFEVKCEISFNSSHHSLH